MTGDHELITLLLLLILGFSIGLGFVLACVVGGLLKRQKPSMIPQAFTLQHEETNRPALRDWMLPRPRRWLALRCRDMDTLQDILSVGEISRCSWEQGLEASQQNHWFIVPTPSEWTLVFGEGLPDVHEDVDKVFHRLKHWSRQVRELQFYQADDLFGHHAWVRMQGASIKRAYAWAGETLWNQGQPGFLEMQLGLKSLDYCETEGEAWEVFPDFANRNVQQIFQLAERWSINPMALGPGSSLADHGWSGRPA